MGFEPMTSAMTVQWTNYQLCYQQTRRWSFHCYSTYAPINVNPAGVGSAGNRREFGAWDYPPCRAFDCEATPGTVTKSVPKSRFSWKKVRSFAIIRNLYCPLSRYCLFEKFFILKFPSDWSRIPPQGQSIYGLLIRPVSTCWTYKSWTYPVSNAALFVLYIIIVLFVQILCPRLGLFLTLLIDVSSYPGELFRNLIIVKSLPLAHTPPPPPQTGFTLIGALTHALNPLTPRGSPLTSNIVNGEH